MMPLARTLILAGLALLVIGGLIYLSVRFELPFGRLPGDFRFQRGSLSCFFPLATSILLSIVLTVLLNLIARWLNK